MTTILTRDPAAYRAKLAARKKAEFFAARDAAIAREKAERESKVELVVQTRSCYEEYLPPQIVRAREMMSCGQVCS